MSPEHKPVKRFIAGAVCPRCGVMDRIVSYVDSSQRSVRECIDCGFHEKLVEPEAAAELETRVTKKRSQPVKAQPLKFYKNVRGKNTKDSPG